MRTLVTGGAGFIGSTLVDALLDDGHEVVVLDNLATGREVNLEGALGRGAHWVRTDVAEPAAVRDAVAGAEPEVVFHLAAQIDVRRAVEDPVFDARVNVGGTAAVLEAARAAGTRRVVFASTGGALYGEADAVPTPEDAPIAPMAPYGTSKWCGEAYLGLYARLHGLSTLALRLGNVYGPRQDPKGEAGVIAIYCDAAREGRTVTVFGDGLQSRDYVFVGDVVDAFRTAAGSDATGALNVGTRRETTVLDLVRILGLDHEHQPARAGEVQRSCLDPSAAERVLGWRAQVSLEDGLARTQRDAA